MELKGRVPILFADLQGETPPRTSLKDRISTISVGGSVSVTSTQGKATGISQSTAKVKFRDAIRCLEAYLGYER